MRDQAGSALAVRTGQKTANTKVATVGRKCSQRTGIKTFTEEAESVQAKQTRTMQRLPGQIHRLFRPLPEAGIPEVA